LTVSVTEVSLEELAFGVGYQANHFSTKVLATAHVSSPYPRAFLASSSEWRRHGGVLLSASPYEALPCSGAIA